MQNKRWTYLRLGVAALITVLVFTVIIGTLPGVLETYSYQDVLCYTLIDSEALADACYDHCPNGYVNCAYHIDLNCNNSCTCTCRLCLQKKAKLCGHAQCVDGACPCSETENGCQCPAGGCRCVAVEPPNECLCDNCDAQFCNCADNGCAGEDCRCDGCVPVFLCPCDNCAPDSCNCGDNGCSGGNCVCEGCPPSYQCPCESCDIQLCRCEEMGCTAEACVCDGCELTPDPGTKPPTIVRPPTGGGGTTSRDRERDSDPEPSRPATPQEPDEIVVPEATPIAEPVEPLQTIEEPLTPVDSGAEQAPATTGQAIAATEQETEEQPEEEPEEEEDERVIIVHDTVPLASLAFNPATDPQWTLTSSASETFATKQDGMGEEKTTTEGTAIPVGGTAGVPAPFLYAGGAVLLAAGVPIYQCIKRRRSLRNISKML